MAKYEYLNYMHIREKDIGSKGVAITCYESPDGYWTCPNPRDEDRADAIAAQYDIGLFLSKRIIRLSESDFNDPANWD